MRASAVERRFQALFLGRQWYSQRPFEERGGEDDIAVGLAHPAFDQRSSFPSLGIRPRSINLRNALQTVLPFLGLGGKQGRTGNADGMQSYAMRMNEVFAQLRG